MKLKRFVAIVISLAMVLSIVPAFSLTASAADMTDDALLSYAKGTTALFDATNPAPTATNDADIATAYPNSGLTGTVNNGYLNVNSGPRIQCYIGSSTNGAETPNYINLPNFGAGNDWALVSFITEYTCAWGNIAWYDIDGNILTALRYGTGDGNCFAPSWGHNGWGTPYSFSNYTLSAEGSVATSVSGSTQVDMLFRNYDPDGTADSGDEYYTVNFYHNGTSVCVGTYTGIGEFNGLGKIALSRGSGGGWQRISMQALKIYAGDIPASTKTITATYTVNGTTVHTKTVTTESDSASFDAYYYSAGNGTNTLYYAAAQTLSESTTIAMSAVEHWGNYSVGDAITVDSTPYVVTGGNIVPNGDFSSGMEGWYSRANTTPPANYSVTTTDKPASATRAAVSSGNGGGGSTNSMSRRWAITPGTTYYYSLWMKTGDAWNGFGESDSATAESSDIVAGTNTSNAWVQKTGVFTATKSYLSLHQAWASVGLADVEVYPVEIDSSKIANTTIKFVDSADGTTEIKDAVTVTGVVGDVIDLSAYSGAITYNGNPYSFDASNPTSYTVAGNTDTVTLTYTTDAYVSFEGTAVTVIQGNDPVLSTTVTAKTGAGSTTVVDGAVWESATGLSAGSHTINGTVEIDGKTISGSVAVTVLPLTFAPGDLAANGTINFPVDVTGDFYVEFDFNATNLDNEWIYISKDAALWGGGQIGLGWDANGNGYFRAQPVAQTDIQFETNKTYRFLVHGNVDTDTYDLTVYDTVTKTVVATADDYGFRSASDAINSIVASSNGEGGAATLTNVKVYAPDQADQFATITFVATGSVSETYTTSYTSAEEFPIPHYDGHIMKTRVVSGNTVTATYEATETSIGSWYMRNNFTDDNWISQSKYIGSHNAFADDDTLFVNDGGALYGDTGASSTGSTSRDNSRTQSVGVLDQLNAGVRYFDVRLSRQSDGTFATVHGPAFENFRDVAISMAQWAKENPGEVIILDFQTVRDALYDNETYTVITDNNSYYGPDEGDDNQYVYDALVQLFEDTGLADYMTTNWDRKYGALTSSGTVTAILPFGKGRAVNCQGGYFVNRSALNNDVTYTEDSSYSDVVSYLDSTYANLTDGATISTIHAYTTPFSLLIAGTPLLEAAQDNNPNWINEEGFYNWMAYGKGDVFMMNDSVSDIDLYYEALNKFNRTGSSYSYTENFIRTDDNVTINGAQANVPFSTKWTVEPTATTATYTIDGKVYTAQTAYALDLMQFNTESVQPTGTVTVTFPMISDGATTVDALLSADGTTVYATAGVGEAISIDTTSLVDVILATVEAPGKEYTVNYVADGTTIYTKTELVPYGQAVYSVPAGDFYLAATDKAYILNSAAAMSHTAASTDTITTFTINVTIVSDNAVLTDTFANNDGSTDCNNTENLLFVGSSGISDPGDADAAGDAVMANNGGNVGSPRIPVLMFNVPEVAEGKAVKLHLYVAKANQNLNNGGSMKLAANVANVTVDEAQGYVASSIANTTGVVWSDTMFTATGDAVSGRMPVDTWVEIDVTEFVAAATGDTITFTLYAPTAGAYVADREKAVAGGEYEGKAAYLEIVDANTVTVTGAALVTKSGKDVTTDAADGILVPVGSTIKARETGAELIAFTDGTNVYTTNSDGWATLTPSSTAEYFAATLGVAMVDGAQVRIGDGVNADGTVAGNSGLRFITTVNRDNSLATVTGATFGVEVTAEGSSAAAVDIPADKWQVEGEVYTSALTDLAVSNYNRNFTATPYVSINGTKYYGSEVTRSIYQVASGLLATGYNGNYGESVDETGTNYAEMPEVLVKVLNGYVNQVGVRLIINEGVLAKSDKYTGSEDTFFTVSNASTNGSVYTCTLTAVGEAEINTDLFNTYVRINNNNSAVKTLVSVVDNGNGTYTLTFDGSSLVTE